jgi:phage FluMu protein Com
MTQPDKVMTPCPSCGATLGVPSTAAGKKIRCPRCQTVVAITAEMVNHPPEKVSPTAAIARQAPGPEVSLGGENTFAGAQKKYAPESLGDEATYGGGRTKENDHFTDDMEIVDLTGRYKIEGVLGKGGMGEVLLATDTRLKRKVAIKRVLGDMAKGQTAMRRFLTEAQSIAAINHPNVVQVHDYGRDKDGPFLILEYVDGQSLWHRCQQGPIPLEDAVNLTCQLCDGLTRSHELGIVHRDLKPANVLLTKEGVPKLTDFGLARTETGDTGQTMSGAVLGTLDFMPPEQRLDATRADARSDVWSLAATLYQMVTSKSPR